METRKPLCLGRKTGRILKSLMSKELFIKTNMKYIYYILITGILLVLWFAPIDLDRERQMANTAPRMLVLFIFENVALKLIFSIFLVWLMVKIKRIE
ncbi:MAG: hypothetical protein ACKO7P_10200 [Bacteroidota bacterium]